MISVDAVMQLHIPVLLYETIRALNIKPGGRYIDCTLGSAGHALAILERGSPGGQLLGIDIDPEAIEVARERLQPYSSNVLLVNQNFADLATICAQYNFHPVDGILFDLGVSSLQLTESRRGFSFQQDGPLNMCFDPRQDFTAATIVNTLPEEELARIIRDYGEEPLNRRIARYIVRNRPLTTTQELAQIVEWARGGRRGQIHPATKTFQALRIAVNQELANLKVALQQAVRLLGIGGRLVVISYHSLEDRIVKEFLNRESKGCLCPPHIPKCICGHIPALTTVTKKVITPLPAEVEFNPRSRSAKLRVAERI